MSYLKLKQSRIPLDDKKVKSETLIVEEEIEGMLLKCGLSYKNGTMKFLRAIPNALKTTCLPLNLL